MHFRSGCIAALIVSGALCLLGADEPKQDLHHNMEAMDRPFKQLRNQIGDASKIASSLELVVQMQQLTLACKTEVPRKIERMPTTQQAEETNNYRQMMVNLLRDELDLEEQLINNDNTKASATLAAMDQLQKDGHKEFRPQRKRGGD